jgi:hypothetical protein
MSKSIKEINSKLRELNDKYKESGLTDGKISHKSAMEKFRGSDSYRKTDEQKLAMSILRLNKPLSKQHIEALKKTKLKFKISKQQILEAQIGTTTAQEVADKLNIDFHTYKGIAEYHKVYKKLSLSERNKESADIIDIWKFDLTKKLNRGKYVGRVTKPIARTKYGIKNMNKFFDGTYKQVNGFVLEKIIK